MRSLQQIFKDAFASIGVTINGDQPWDMQVHNPKFYERIVSEGTLGFGEAYMEGWWDCEALDEFLFKVLNDRLHSKLPILNLGFLFFVLKAKYKNLQTKSLSKEVAFKHYDLGNDLFTMILDKRMTYSCGYWKTATNLDDAQDAKLDLICRKLKLEKGMTLLDLGCGWGSLSRYAAEKYGVIVTGITISEEQAAVAREVNKGLPVDIRVVDYRDLHEKFDRIASIEVAEHIGYRNYRKFMQMADENLNKDGIFLIQTSGGNHDAKRTEPWIDKYIFPNGMVPSASQLSKAWQGLFILEDWHNFGLDYDPTLTAWINNLEENRDRIKTDYDESFYRMWRYFLCGSAASFRSRHNQVWQIVLTKRAHLGIYESVR